MAPPGARGTAGPGAGVVVLLTALLNRHYDVWLILVSGSALVLTGIAVLVGLAWQP